MKQICNTICHFLDYFGAQEPYIPNNELRFELQKSYVLAKGRTRLFTSSLHLQKIYVPVKCERGVQKFEMNPGSVHKCFIEEINQEFSEVTLISADLHTECLGLYIQITPTVSMKVNLVPVQIQKLES